MGPHGPAMSDERRAMKTVAHDIAGSGDPVYLVAGLGQVGERWHRVIPRLAEEYTVVTLDNRETGRTGGSTENFGLPDLGGDVLALASALGHDRFFLMGISMGGMISQEVVRQGGDRVRAAVLLATYGEAASRVPPEDLGILLRGGEGLDLTTDPGRMEAAKRGWASLTGPGFADAHPDVVDEEAALGIKAATPPIAYMKQMQAINQWDPADALVGTPVPIVVGHGNADPLVPYANGVNLSSALGVELVTYEGSGHWLEVERAAEVAQLAKDHFAKAAARQAAEPVRTHGAGDPTGAAMSDERRAMSRERRAMSRGTAGRTLLRKEERQQSILAAAARAFAETGFASTSMEDVAGAAGITKLIVYRHFESKEELYRAVLQRVSDRLAEEFIRGVTAADRRGVGVRALLTVAREDAPAFALLWRQATREPQFSDYAREHRERAVGVARLLLRSTFADPMLVRWGGRDRGLLSRRGRPALAGRRRSPAGRRDGPTHDRRAPRGRRCVVRLRARSE